MKSLIYFTLFYFSINTVFGQDVAMVSGDIPKPKAKGNIEKLEEKHPKKMYAADKEHVYVQKSKKVYIWVSNSDDPSAEKELLVTTDEAIEYFYLDTEGLNTIRSPWAVDPITGIQKSPKVDVIYNIYADGKAPVTQANFTGSTSYFNNGKVYYGKWLSVELLASDRVSGMENIFVSIDNGAYGTYNNRLEISKENENSITYYAVDNVGNVEAPTTKNFFVDKTAPTTNYQVLGLNEGNVISANAKIKLTGTDNLSDIRRIKYRIGSEGDFRNYTGTISLANVADGDFEINYFAIDNVNNTEDLKNTSIDFGQNEAGEKIGTKLYIDKTAPEVNFEIDGDMHKGKYTYVSERSKLKLNATDNKAGVKEVTFGINSASSSTAYAGPFCASTGKTLQYINYTAIDKVNNKTTKKSNLVYLDKTAPKSNIKFVGTQVIERDSLFITSATKINLSTTELESGLKQMNYTINKASSINYEGKFSVAKEGIHNIEYAATDNVNNVEATKSQVFVVDNTPPKISHTFSFPALGKREVEGQTYTILPSYIKIYLAAVDKTTGVNKVWYRVNGGTVKEKSTVEYFKKGQFEVEVFAKDHLGNQSTETIKIIVE